MKKYGYCSPEKTFALWLVIALVSIAQCHAEERINVDDLKNIYVSKSGARLDLQAANQLAQGLHQLYAIKISITRELPEEGSVIAIGKKSAFDLKIINADKLKEVMPGGYIIRTRGGRIAIAGDNGYTTKYGVIAFLAKLGLRQYGYGLMSTRKVIHLAKPKDRLIPALQIKSKPAMPYRIYATRPEWAEANKALDVLNPELKGKTDQWIDHSAGYLVPKDVYYDEHPEYYSILKDGKRIAKKGFSYHRTPLCLSNPDVTKISIERALKWVELQPEKTYFPISYGDTGLWCQCENCKKLDPAPGENATRLLKWVNAVARAIGEKYPDKIILTYAYGGSDKAPPKIRPEKNVWMIASISGWGSTGFFDHIMAQNQMKGNTQKLAGWLEIAPGQLSVCEYIGGTYIAATADSMAGRIRHYKKIGIIGIPFSFGHPLNFRPLWMYLYRRLMWDPEQDVTALTRDFALHYYGPAGEGMADYLDLLHQRYQETLKNKDKLKGGYPEGFYSKVFTDKAIAAFRKARTAGKGNPKLYKEICKETKMFIMDWIKHPVSKEMNEKAKADLRKQLDSLLELTGKSDKEQIEFARSIHRMGVAAESQRKGVLLVMEEWLAKKNFPKPKGILITEGVRLPAEIFMYAGFGPALYKGGHVAPPCPEKMAVGIYVKGNSLNRSHRTEAVFDLEKIEGDGTANLEILGQDCDHKVDTAEIRILVNGTKIFEGQVGMVKWNWSLQGAEIPAGVLRKGTNKVEIQNSADLKTIKKWHERWVMIAEVSIRFKKK